MPEEKGWVKAKRNFRALGWALLLLGFVARPGMTDDLPSAPATADQKPEMIEPLFVRPLVKIESGRNDSNPVWSPRGAFIAFERSVGEKKEIRIALPDGTPIQTVYFML